MCSTSNKLEPPCGNRTRRWVVVTSWLALSTWTAAVQAQYQVSNDGRLLDANPQLGGSPYNYSRPATPLLGGNLTATGNVGRGLGLRSFSPITDPTAFRGPLGSNSLSNYVRDSVSAYDAASPLGGLLARPYYDASGTVPTGAFLQQGYGASPAQPFPFQTPASYTPDGTVPEVLRSLGPLDFRLNVAQGAVPAGQPSPVDRPGELSSTIFGVTTPRLPLPGPVDEQAEQRRAIPSWLESTRGDSPRQGEPARVLPSGLEPPTEESPSVSPTALPDLRIAQPMDFRKPLGPSAQRLTTPLDLVLKGDATRLLMGGGVVSGPRADQITGQPASPSAMLPGPQPTIQPGGPATAPPPEVSRPGMIPLEAPREPIASQLPMVPVVPLTGDASMLPGYDVYTDMRLALALSGDVRADWYNEMKSAMRSDPKLSQQMQEYAHLESQQFVSLVMNAPLQTFVGRGPSQVNNELLKAESLMDVGQYYAAAARYEVAYRLDPTNPLPLIGKGHALLAAGEYLSAAVQLIRGLESFPDLARFRVDLRALIGSGEIIDIRRSDILKRLEQHEDSRLRFLLGYIEYHSDNRESGLVNLEKAAAAAEPDSIIRRYPAMLRGSTALPPPKLPELDPSPSAPLAPPPQTNPETPEHSSSAKQPTAGRPAPALLFVEEPGSATAPPPAVPKASPATALPPAGSKAAEREPSQEKQELNDLMAPPKPVMRKEPR